MSDGRITMKEALENIAAATKALPTAEEFAERLHAVPKLNSTDYFAGLSSCTMSKPIATQHTDGSWEITATFSRKKSLLARFVDYLASLLVRRIHAPTRRPTGRQDADCP